MDEFYVVKFGRRNYVHDTINTNSWFWQAIDLRSEKFDSVVPHLLEAMTIMGQIKIDNTPVHVFN